jgi:hypothetical protein
MVVAYDETRGRAYTSTDQGFGASVVRQCISHSMVARQHAGDRLAALPRK